MITVEEVAVSLTRENGLQHLGQIAKFALLVDEADKRFRWTFPGRGHYQGEVSFDTPEQAWLDCISLHYSSQMCLALLQLAGENTPLHPHVIRATAGYVKRINDLKGIP